MHLEDYFDVLGPDDIRIRGHRIGIETVLYEYIHRSQSPEQIAAQFPTLSLEEVYATILYYLRNRETVSAYLADWLEQGEQARAAQDADPTIRAGRQRLRRAREEHNARAGTAAAGVTHP